jgi:mannan polymerase II complex MNN10 subunit
MLARSSPGTLAFFSATRAYHDTHKDLSEQDCIAELINAAQKPELDTAESQQLQKQVRFVPQHRMNAFPEEIRCWEDGFKWSRDGKERRNGMWKRGDFAVHFAGAWAHVHENDPTGLLMRKYEMSVDGDVSEEGIW